MFSDLTGRIKYRQSFWTGRPVLRVEYRSSYRIYDGDIGKPAENFRWRDARWEDLERLERLRKTPITFTHNLPGREPVKPIPSCDILGKERP